MRKFSHFLIVSLVFAAIILWTQTFTFPKVDAAPQVSVLGQGAPYTRYPRFVEIACGSNGIAFDVVSKSKGGNTYGEMYFIFSAGTDVCNMRALVTKPYVHVTPTPVVHITSTPVTPVVTDVPVTPVVTSTPPVVVVTPQPTQPPVVVTPAPTQPPSTPESQNDKKKCNKGGGNGNEGCDPGNNPNNGNDDEGGLVFP